MEPTVPVAPAAAVAATEAPEKEGAEVAATEDEAVATRAEAVAKAATMTGLEMVLMCSIRTLRVFKTCRQPRVQNPAPTQPIVSHK